uniref:Uncharacterized protein n=1 Tax=Anguilla anguilla TaxID=7936 RepID=A0A0E9WG75_ANGAN
MLGIFSTFLLREFIVINLAMLLSFLAHLKHPKQKNRIDGFLWISGFVETSFLFRFPMGSHIQPTVSLLSTYDFVQPQLEGITYTQVMLDL